MGGVPGGRFLRAAAFAVSILLLAATAFDAVAYFVFPDTVRRIAPKFRDETETVAEPRYFRPSATRGFDIEPGVRFVSRQPPEAGSYDVWANSLGCFDDEPPADTAPDIYLAGDSFTWGFAPYETKFGTIVERETGLLTYACGVPHTGPRHQFEKFLEIAETFPGWPALVIVNVYTNDIANDYFFPHSTAADGRMVEDTFLERAGARTSVHRLADPEPLGTGPFPDLATRYSATAVILSESGAGFSTPARRTGISTSSTRSAPIPSTRRSPHRTAAFWRTGWSTPGGMITSCGSRRSPRRMASAGATMAG
jgi:hypothetical protein